MKYILRGSVFQKDQRILGVVLGFLLAVSALLLAIGAWVYWSHPPTWYGYVVGDDRKVYMVNLDTGILQWVSRELDQIHSPTQIDINHSDSILYIASGSYLPRNDYVPVVAIKLNDKADVVFESNLYSDTSTVFPSAWILRYNSSGNSLYVSHLGGSHAMTTLNPLSGEVIGGIKAYIRKDEIFSPDGRRLASILPERSQVRDGKVEILPGAVIIVELDSNDILSLTYLEENKGLYPPWGQTHENYVYVHNRGEGIWLEVYDRASGKQLAAHDLQEIFGSTPNQLHATPIPGTEDVAMSIGGYVVVFDPLTAEVKSKTYVADTILTEVVVTDKPLLRTDITSIERAAEQ